MQDIKDIAIINGKPIQVVENDSILYVPVRPICELLGVSVQNQLQKLKSDTLYDGSVITLRVTTDKDNKQYSMSVITLEMVCMWIGSINANNVKEEVRADLIKYQRECARVLYEAFFVAPKKYDNFISRYNILDKKCKELENVIKEAKQSMKPIMKEMAELDKNIKNQSCIQHEIEFDSYYYDECITE